MGSLPKIDADVCVVGAGIVGIAHAHEALARGLRVVVLDRSDRAVGASVRNFGHGFVSAMADGPALGYALDARRRWLELGARAGLEISQDGSLIVARHEDELAVLEAVAADERRSARMLAADEIGELAPLPTGELLGALHATLDIRVDPRQAVARLADLLQRSPDALVMWGAPVHAVEPGLVESSRVAVHAPRILLCPGPDYDTLPAAVRPRREGLSRCRLQMLRVGAPDGRRYDPALLTGLSLVRYPAFAAAAGAAAIRERLERERPELIEAGIHLIVTQLSDGDLIIGDSHQYGGTVSPFAEERIDELVLAEACRLLGVSRLEVRQRWHGVYPTAPGDLFLVEEPMPGVRVVEVVSGVGMTTALGLAIGVLDDLLDDVSEPLAGREPPRSASPPPSAQARAGYGS